MVREFRMMAFTGGEPLLRPDVFDLPAHAQRLGFTNTMATNATRIDDSVARDLRKRGLVIAAVSLDGLDAEGHDRIRGVYGAFDAALRGMAALRRAGILLHINVTAMQHYNAEDMEALLQMVDEQQAAILLMYQLVPVGRGQMIDRVALDRAANERLMRCMIEAQRSARAIFEPVAGPQFWALLLRQAGISGRLPLRLAEQVWHGCSAGRGFAYIKPDGTVWPCPFIEQSCGNVRKRPFAELWAGGPVLDALRQRETLLKGQCGACAYRRVCGGCRARALSATGDLMAEDPSCFIHAADMQSESI